MFLNISARVISLTHIRALLSLLLLAMISRRPMMISRGGQTAAHGTCVFVHSLRRQDACLVDAAADGREPAVGGAGVHGLHIRKSARGRTSVSSSVCCFTRHCCVRGTPNLALTSVRANTSARARTPAQVVTSVMWKDMGESSRSSHWL